MVAKVTSVALAGFEGSLVEVETDMKQGLPGIQVVGMGNKAVDEARERVRSAITNSLLDFPPRKLTINLAPAELPKDGAHFDLTIAVSILVASGQLRQTEVDEAVFAGELALTGELRVIRGVINIAEAAQKAGFTTVYVPKTNEQQAALIEGISVIGVENLKELFLHLKGEIHLAPAMPPESTEVAPPSSPTFDDIHGQQQAKRALLIATAGRHNILICGPPGAGKTMLAKAVLSILPSLSPLEQLAVTKIHSLAGEVESNVIARRPFRTPHHTTSAIAMIGGGGKPKPGEISLAHLGVLFLDELPEYPRTTLEALRQPLEDKKISIARANGRLTYPADFMLVATMNPCPCGYLGDPSKECTCSSQQILNYQKRLSGPLLDRIDLVINVSKVDTTTLLMLNTLQEEHQSTLVKNISDTIGVQRNRYKRDSIYNGSLCSQDLKKYAQLSPAAEQLLNTASAKLSLTARSYFKVIKVARTIADLAQSRAVEPEHMSEALRYRVTPPS